MSRRALAVAACIWVSVLAGCTAPADDGLLRWGLGIPEESEPNMEGLLLPPTPYAHTRLIAVKNHLEEVHGCSMEQGPHLGQPQELAYWLLDACHDEDEDEKAASAAAQGRGHFEEIRRSAQAALAAERAGWADQGGTSDATFAVMLSHMALTTLGTAGYLVTADRYWNLWEANGDPSNGRMAFINLFRLQARMENSALIREAVNIHTDSCSIGDFEPSWASFSDLVDSVEAALGNMTSVGGYRDGIVTGHISGAGLNVSENISAWEVEVALPSQVARLSYWLNYLNMADSTVLPNYGEAVHLFNENVRAHETYGYTEFADRNVQFVEREWEEGPIWGVRAMALDGFIWDYSSIVCT